MAGAQAGYDADAFHQKMNAAMERVRRLFHEARLPRPASEVRHAYGDKYELVEFMSRVAIASQLNCLAELGVSLDRLKELRSWAETQAVSLRFCYKSKWALDRKEERTLERPVASQTAGTSCPGGVQILVRSVAAASAVTEDVWRYDVDYELWACRASGAAPEDRVRLGGRSGHMEQRVVGARQPRFYGDHTCAQHDVNVSWLLRHLQSDCRSPSFSVDRADDRCRTPRRCPATEGAADYFCRFAEWSREVVAVMLPMFKPLDEVYNVVGPRVEAIEADATFLPVLPLLLDGDAPSPGGASICEGRVQTSLLASSDGPGCSDAARAPQHDDAEKLLAEELRVLRERRAALGELLPGETGGMATAIEAAFAATLGHCCRVCEQFLQGIEQVEAMLQQQLVAAIGHELTAGDFAEYMRFHCQRLFAGAYSPMPFCYTIRRSARHSPEGTLSIEQRACAAPCLVRNAVTAVIGKMQLLRDFCSGDWTSAGLGCVGVPGPIATFVARCPEPLPMRFSLSASATATFHGDRFLHAWHSPRFEGAGPRLCLIARARQFSSMIVMVGRIVAADAFDPKYAFILQNRDEMTLPLELSLIPSPKEFKDAIASLSPEQQKFAKAFRAMQLESTLFGVLVLQVKPQLERVLNLPEDSLTKEIRLTQDLLQLFVEYQIPSDILAFNSADAARESPGLAERVEQVKGRVSAVLEMIGASRAEEVAQREREERHTPPPEATAPAAKPLHPAALLREEFQARYGGSSSEEAVRLACAEAIAAFGEERARGLWERLASFAGQELSCQHTLVLEIAIERALFLKSIGRDDEAYEVARAAFEDAIAELDNCSEDTYREALEPIRRGDQAAPQHAQQRPPEGPDAGHWRDLTDVPRQLDRRLEDLDPDGAVRPAVISVGSAWTKRVQEALLGSPRTSTLRSDQQLAERGAAFDLLDALTKSGAIPIDHASLHVVLATSHCMQKTLMDTLIQDSVNPIDKLARTTLIMAELIHQRPAASLVQESQLARVTASYAAIA